MLLFEGLLIWLRFGKSAAKSRKRPFNVSRLCLSTALWVARRSAVLARLEGLREFLLLAEEPPEAPFSVDPSPGVRGASESAVEAGEGGLLEGSWMEGSDIMIYARGGSDRKAD